MWPNYVWKHSLFVLQESDQGSWDLSPRIMSSWFQKTLRKAICATRMLLFDWWKCWHWLAKEVQATSILCYDLEILSYGCLMVLPCIEFLTHTIEVTTDIFDEMLHLHKETDLTISVSLKLAFALRFEKPNSKKCYDSAVWLNCPSAHLSAKSWLLP